MNKNHGVLMLLFFVATASAQEVSPTDLKQFKDDSLNNSKFLPRKAMIAVIFEVYPAEGRKQEYLDIAKSLLPQLSSIDGFISIERFESLYTPGKILSLSYWRDEQAVQQWRNTEEHRLAQAKGRKDVFLNYRLCVVKIVRDYGMFDRAQAPDDNKAYHDKP
jgi:heme-degrading monooxygenase HmoA